MILQTMTTEEIRVDEGELVNTRMLPSERNQRLMQLAAAEGLRKCLLEIAGEAIADSSYSEDIREIFRGDGK